MNTQPSPQPSPLWTDTSSADRMTGTWRSALPQYHNMASPCFGACPVGGRIAEWIRQVEVGDHHGAWLTLVDNNPFPAISGRVCHHPCEDACNRQYLDETLAICALERFVGDLALERGWAFEVAQTSRAQSVAVVGGGPAGLSAAYQLRRAGFRVSLYEAQGQLGGLLRHGIPAYRLDRAVLDGEIARIVDMGITVHLNHTLADGTALQQLRAQHDAVFLATGASRPKPLPGLDYDQPWVLDSAAFLAATNAGQGCALGAHVLVIGGGSAAMDVARTARRLGRDVTVLALESEDTLPAQRAEVDEAAEEGVRFVTGAMMQSVTPDGTGLTIACVRVRFTAGAAHGAFSVDPVEDSDFALNVDAVVPAIGQDADLARWQGVLRHDGAVLQSGAGGRTAHNGIFVGGDVAGMDRFVTRAIGMGKEAAQAIAAHIDPDSAVQATLGGDVPFERINTAYFPTAAGIRPAKSDSAARLDNFQEVVGPLGVEAALTEASRCFSCGICTLCDNCHFYCPDMAILKLDNAYEVLGDYCKGCGLCVAECPTGAIQMYEDAAR